MHLAFTDIIQKSPIYDKSDTPIQVVVCRAVESTLLLEKLKLGSDDIRKKKKSPEKVWFVIDKYQYVILDWWARFGDANYQYTLKYVCNGVEIAGIGYKTIYLYKHHLTIKVEK